MPKPHSLSRRELFSLTGGLAGGAVAASPLASQDRPLVELADGVTVPPGSREVTGVLYEAVPGPWGVLNYFYFYLESPAHLIDLFPLRNPRTRWAVPVAEEAAFQAILQSAPMDAAERSALLNPDNIGIGNGVFTIFPPAQVLVSLNPEARGMIYNYLARFEENPDIKNPVRIRSGSVEEWARGTTIRPELVEQMKAMTYFKGDLMLFGDFPHLISQARSDAEARALQKHSSRVRSMVVRLDVKQGSSIESISNYWTTGLGLRRKEVEPLLLAAIQTPGVSTLDLMHLLPPLARKLLYTYPDASMAGDGILPDCHWTALNFFNYSPEPIYLDEFFAASRLLSGFEQVDPPYRYGDAIVFVSEEMNAYHSCIYLAADIVYTKNGRSLYAPWTLLPLKDVEATYPDAEGKPLRIQGFRKLPT